MRIKELGRIAEKWRTVSPGRAQDYVDGASAAGAEWQRAAAAAEAVYKQAVVEAANAGRYGRGVSSAGAEKYVAGIQNKGSARWSAGITASGDAYQQGFAPYHQVLAGLTLPPRGVKGSPQNIQRVALIAQALHKKKLSL